MADAEENPSRPQNQKSCGKILLRLLFSHLGLFLLVSLYAALGAWIFLSIEYGQETFLREERMLRSLDVNDTLTYLANKFYFTCVTGDLTQEEWVRRVYAQLKEYDRYVVSVTKHFKYDGTLDESQWDREWTFGSSLLYAVTILTTIGYGNVAPNTQLGKVVTILYAVLGIPLTLVFLANIGDGMATTFRYLYSRVCCRWCRGSRRTNEFSRETIAKMGGRLPPLRADEVGKEEYMPTDKVIVPIVLNLLLISLYILFGALMFAYVEEWDLLSSGYFTFITLTTIGFGDYYPGAAFEGYQGGASKTMTLLGTCFYMMMGMALVSMCISLMQQQLIEKMKWFAREIGLVQQQDIEDTDKKPLTRINFDD